MEDESVVRSALASLRDRQRHGDVRVERAATAPRREGPSPVAFLAGLVATIAGVALAVTIVSRDTSPRACAPITYAFEGGAPAQTRTAFTAAAGEITRVTGLRFEPARDTAPRLTVAWTDDVHVVAGHASGVSDRATPVGSALARWHSDGLYRVLDGAAIEVDARWNWAGRAAADGLRSVLVHELGHVVGLHHSADRDSYMYRLTRPTPPRWTAADRQQLAKIGAAAGCRP